MINFDYRKDGNFEIQSVKSGSYLVEVINSNYKYKSIRVDINSKGKIRAREVNYIQPSLVELVPYPLEFKSPSPYNYFEERKSWSLIHVLFSPYVIMLLLPIVMFLTLPYLINCCDSKSKKELENFSLDFDGPELSEMVTNLFAKRPREGKKMSKQKIQ